MCCSPITQTKLQLIIMLSTNNGFLSGCGCNSVSLKEGEKITQTLLNVANQAFSKLDCNEMLDSTCRL